MFRSALDVKLQLLIRGIKQTDIARELKVKPSVISRVIHGHAKSKRVEDYISSILNKKAA